MRNYNPDIPETLKPGVLLQLRQNRTNRNHFGIVLALNPDPAEQQGHYQADVFIGELMHTINVHTYFGEIRYSGYPKERDGYGRVFVMSVFPEPSENTDRA